MVDDFQAISVILALATVLFGLQYQKILDALRTPVPTGPVARADMVREIKDTMLYRAAPVTAISGVSAYLLLPRAIDVIRTDHFAFWRFNFIETAWLCVCCLLFLVFAWSLTQLVRLWIMVRQTTRSPKNV